MAPLKQQLSFLVREGYKGYPKGKVKTIFTLYALAAFLFVLWLSLFGQLPPYQYSVIFFTLTIPPTFLIVRPTAKKRKSPYWFDWILAALTFLSSIYLITRTGWALERIAAFDPLTVLDKFASIVCLLAVIELCRRALGWAFTIIVALFTAYTFFGHLVPGIFYHRQLEMQTFLDTMFFSANGVFGSAIAIVASYAFLFVTFGLFYEKAGGGNFLFDLAASMTGKQKGAEAKVAVVSSGAFGTISGSPAADVATTGSVTIPMMKKSGYKPTFAGAVETAASSGGALLPPIMGTAAFLMVEFTGISYRTIILSSLLSGALYYYVLFLQVHYRSKKLGLKSMDEDEIPKLKNTILKGWLYFIPVFTLLYVILSGFTPSRAAIFGIVATMVVSWLFKKNRILFRESIKIIHNVLYAIAPLVVATAAAGLLIGTINLTGLAGKFTGLIFTIAGDSLILVLVIAAIISILLGMGMPTPAVYVLTATLVAPAIIEAGVPLLPAHLFLIFFAAMSAITPPVGVAAYTAAGIADASPLAIGATAVKLAIAAFLLPFMFVFQQALILQADPVTIVLSIIFACIGLFAVALGCEGYWLKSINGWNRGLFIISGVAVTYPHLLSTILGLAVMLTVMFVEYKQKKNKKSLGDEQIA